FIFVSFAFLPHTVALNHALTSAAYDATLRPVVLQVIVAVVTFLWVRSATQAIARADRAEEVAKLQHVLAERDREAAEQKEQLEMGVQQILDTHVRVANGNFGARAP